LKKVEHVLMTADTMGGVWNYAIELSRILGKFDVQVSLATMGSRLSPQQKAEARKLSNLHLYESSFKLEWMPEPWDDIKRAGEWLLQLEAILDPDIVHLNGYCHGALSWHSPTVVVCHSCVLSWWQAVKNERAPIDWICYEDEVREGLMKANRVIAPTEAMLDLISKHYGYVSNGRVIYNARNGKDFPPLEKEPLILTVGRLWDEAKNVAALDAIATQVDWPIYAAGEAVHPNRDGTKHENVIGLGKLSTEDVASWYGRASIYALPARYEPFGLSALEAALAECALVLGDIPTLREVWGDSAIYIDPEDREALAQELKDLIKDPEKRTAMAKKAHARARLFEPERMGCEYLEVYEELMREHSATTSVRNRVELH
jgi:glycogen(starch) synthase